MPGACVGILNLIVFVPGRYTRIILSFNIKQKFIIFPVFDFEILCPF